MFSLMDRYMNMVRNSKWKAILVSGCFAAVCFILSYVYRDKSLGFSDRRYMLDSFIFSIIIGTAWYFSSLMFVKMSDNMKKKEMEKEEAALQEKRRKAEERYNKKVNNKKKKKNRNKKDAVQK